MKKHDTIATRLSLILTKFNNGEKLTVDELVKEFGVTKRTIQRDINERFSHIPIQKEKGFYFLEKHYLGKVTFDDIHNLATLKLKILQSIEDDETIWFSNSKTEVLLKVDAYASQFFKRRKVVAYQKILEEYADGSLLLSTQMTFEDEVLQLVRSMIPHITIVSPVALQEKLEDSLRFYLL